MRALRRNPALLAWHEFFSNIRFYYPVAIVYFESVGGSYAAAMSVFSVMALSTALFEIPTGMFADRIGRRTTMILVGLSKLATVACFAGAHGLPLLLAGGAFYGLGKALLSGNGDAILYETMAFYRKKHRYADVTGKVGGMVQAALALSSFSCALMLGAGFTLRLLAILSLIPVSLSLIAAFLMTEPPRAERQTARAESHLREAAAKVWRNPVLRRFSAASILHDGMENVFNNFAPGFIATLWPLWAMSLLRGTQHILGIAVFWTAGRILRRFRPLPVLCTSMLGMNAAQTAIALSANVLSPFLIYIHQFFYCLNTVARTTFLQSQFSDAERVTMGSIISFGGQMVYAVAALLIGLLADAAGPAIALLATTLLSLPASFIVWNLISVPKNG